MTQKPSDPKRVLPLCLEMLWQEGETVDSVLARFPQHAESLRPELEAAAWLKTRQKPFEPRPGFIAASRDRLVARVGAQSAGSRSRWWSRRVWLKLSIGGRRRLAIQALLAILLLASAFFSGSNLLQASATWLPGDIPYPLKIVTEESALWLTPSAEGDARLHVEFTRRRLMEVQALFFENRYEEVPATVVSFADHVAGAVEAVNQVASRNPEEAKALAADLQEALSGQTRLVLLLAGFSPTPARTEFERVVQISEDGLAAMQDVLSPGSGQVEILALQNCKGRNGSIV